MSLASCSIALLCITALLFFSFFTLVIQSHCINPPSSLSTVSFLVTHLLTNKPMAINSWLSVKSSLSSTMRALISLVANSVSSVLLFKQNGLSTVLLSFSSLSLFSSKPSSSSLYLSFFPLCLFFFTHYLLSSIHSAHSQPRQKGTSPTSVTAYPYCFSINLLTSLASTQTQKNQRKEEGMPRYLIAVRWDPVRTLFFLLFSHPPLISHHSF